MKGPGVFNIFKIFFIFYPALRTRETWTKKTIWEPRRGVDRARVLAEESCETTPGWVREAAGSSTGSRSRQVTGCPGISRTEPKVIGSTQQGESQVKNLWYKIIKANVNHIYDE